MRRLSELEIRTKLMKLLDLTDECDMLLAELENTENCNAVAGDFDVMAAMRVRIGDLREAAGYARTGPMLLPLVKEDLGLPPITGSGDPIPRGWDKIEAGATP